MSSPVKAVSTVSRTAWADGDDSAIENATILGRARVLLSSGRVLPGLLLQQHDEASARPVYVVMYLEVSTGLWRTWPLDEISDGHGARRSP